MDLLSMSDQAPRVVLLKVSQGRMRNNSYLAIDPASREAVAIDPAWQIEKFESALASHRANLSGILITHTHFDHIHLAKPLAERHDCPIWVSRREIATSTFRHPHLIEIDETPWSIGKLLIRPLCTPGHTPGCVCYLIGNNLFTGDVLFAEGCGICADVESAHEMFDSLKRLKTQLDPRTLIFPGHTYVRPPGQEFSQLLRWNMYLQFPDRHSFAAYRLRSNQSIHKLLDFK